MNTNLTIKADKFLINGKLTYSEIEGSNSNAHGLLMNARFIQGVFDDKQNPLRFARFGAKKWNAEQNTENLIEALSEWYNYGLRAFTVGFQGGGPCFTADNYTIDNNPYSSDGLGIDSNYLRRMKKLILAADSLGMIVIVSCFYCAQARFLENDSAVMNAVKTTANWLRDNGFKNIIIEIANEKDMSDFQIHPVIYTDSGMCSLLEIARRESGGMPVGCSHAGGVFSEAVAAASDVILIHGNGITRQGYYNLIQKAKAIKPARPIVCNEDSQAVSQIDVAFKTQTSWGYYNNVTKQEPPTNWKILQGEDSFFAYRMAMGIGIKTEPLEENEQFYLQGLEPEMTANNKRWVKLAALFPEKIDYVDFYRNDEHIYTAYDDPFTVYFNSNWHQSGIENVEGGAVWRAVIKTVDEETRTIEKQAN